jgi:hypothetical protein
VEDIGMEKKKRRAEKKNVGKKRLLQNLSKHKTRVYD